MQSSNTSILKLKRDNFSYDNFRGFATSLSLYINYIQLNKVSYHKVNTLGLFLTNQFIYRHNLLSDLVTKLVIILKAYSIGKKLEYEEVAERTAKQSAVMSMHSSGVDRADILLLHELENSMYSAYYTKVHNSNVSMVQNAVDKINTAFAPIELKQSQDLHNMFAILEIPNNMYPAYDIMHWTHMLTFSQKYIHAQLAPHATTEQIKIARDFASIEMNMKRKSVSWSGQHQSRSSKKNKLK